MEQIMNYVKPELLVLAIVSCGKCFEKVGNGERQIYSDYTGRNGYHFVWNLGGVNQFAEFTSGNIHGSIYSFCTGNSRCRIEHIYRSAW